MKILQLCPRLPYPLHDGGAIGIYNITKYLALRGHEIRMVALSNEETMIPEELTKICSVTAVSSKYGAGFSLSKLLDSWFSNIPFTINKYQEAAYYDTVENEVQTRKFDVIHADHLAMAPYAIFLKNKYNIPIVLREHNLETVLLKRFSDAQKNLLLKLYTKYEAKKMSEYEPKICELFDACVTISENDACFLRSLSKKINNFVVPAGVSIPKENNGNHKELHSILFLASLNWQPNVQGFMWFIENVLPLIVEQIPDATVTIVGNGEKSTLKFFSHPNVQYIGYVKDVQAYLKRATLCIVPLFVGSGMRIKILEMMAASVAVVTTSVGIEGINAQHNKEVMIADSPQNFASSVVELLNNEAHRKLLEQSALNLVRSKYSWENSAKHFETIYQKVCGV